MRVRSLTRASSCRLYARATWRTRSRYSAAISKSVAAKTANDGETALRTAAEWLPDLVLLDIGLPDMSGYEVVTRLRKNPALSGTIMVAVTGWGSAEDRKKSKEAGFDEHFTKPVEDATVMTLMQRTSERR